MPITSPTPSDDADQADMERLMAGRDSALNDLMQRHGERLLHYLIRLLQDEAEASDLAQETFVRVYLKRAQFKAGHKFSTWLYAIATNLARDRIRRLSRQHQVSLDAEQEGESTLKDTLRAAAPSPTEELDASERAAAVRKAVAELPEELRVPLVLAEYEDQSHAEIAVVLECSPKAVETRIYRARQQLRVRLSRWLSPESALKKV